MLYSIHLLRFIACLAVVTSHSANVIDHAKVIAVGDAGVDVFFVISGIVINVSTRDGSSPLTFVLKRAIRIIPLYWMATAAYAGYRYWMWSLVPDVNQSWRSVLLIPSFERGFQPIVFQAWTLYYEALFYLLFSIVLAVTRRNTAIICAVFAALIFPTHVTPGDMIDTEYFLEFAAGLAIGEYTKHALKSSYILGAALIAASFIVFCFNYADLGSHRYAGWGGPSACLALGLLQFEKLEVLRNTVVKILGSATYAIYLFHITAMTVLRETLAGPLHIDIHAHEMLVQGMMILASLLCGVIIHRFVERPTLEACRRLVFGRKTISPAESY